jgi:hypothetical protein
LLLVFALAGCKEEQTAARVGGTTISAEQVDRILEHAREEAKREGKAFPADGTANFRALQRQALDLLVYHEELAQKAATIGVSLSDRELERAVAATRAHSSETESGKEGEAFLKASLRGELLYRRVYERVGKSASVGEGEIRSYYQQHPEQYRQTGLSLTQAAPAIRKNLLDTKKSALMAQWIARMKSEYATKVTYASKVKP